MSACQGLFREPRADRVVTGTVRLLLVLHVRAHCGHHRAQPRQARHLDQDHRQVSHTNIAENCYSPPGAKTNFSLILISFSLKALVV